jgi:hypothetical protein
VLNYSSGSSAQLQTTSPCELLVHLSAHHILIRISPGFLPTRIHGQHTPCVSRACLFVFFLEIIMLLSGDFFPAAFNCPHELQRCVPTSPLRVSWLHHLLPGWVHLVTAANGYVASPGSKPSQTASCTHLASTTNLPSSRKFSPTLTIAKYGVTTSP